MSSHWKNLGILKKRYDIPLEAIVKSDLLRMGISFSDQTLQKTVTCKAKSYFIFSFDRALQKDLSAQSRHATPEEIALSGGPENFKRTIVSVRLNPKSPYHVDYQVLAPTANPLTLFYLDEKICDVSLPSLPDYYKEKLSNGKPVSDIAPTIEWGYLIYITAFRLCQYWGSKEECRFCDINENYRQQKKKRSYTAVKTIEEVLEALEIIQTNDTQKISRAYTVSGGSITTNLNGKTESTFYASYAKAIEKKFPGRWIGKANVQALVLDDVKKLKEAGYQIYHPNYEVWDQSLFRTLCPGKERHVGRAEWIKRTLDAAEIFGPSHVIPNFVAGVEMSEPYGFKTVPEAIQSTAEGLEFFMSKGICPRFTVWCVEPNTVLCQTNTEPPPLEYFVNLLQVYRDTHRKYKLPVPPGYGLPGIGKAVFSVSAFMDVL
ncbi:MAG: radical SAM protein [Deltaproteobacteria bacterium]|nr:radical SAM protein [Deltaproteobacteria bacterium]